MNEALFINIIKMFSPAERDFLNFQKSEVIQGPNDRSMFGFDTFFPIKWLVEDFAFSEEEAKEFIKLVNKYSVSEN